MERSWTWQWTVNSRPHGPLRFSGCTNTRAPRVRKIGNFHLERDCILSTDGNWESEETSHGAKTQRYEHILILLSTRAALYAILSAKREECDKNNYSADASAMATERVYLQIRWASRGLTTFFAQFVTDCCVVVEEPEDLLSIEKGVCRTMAETHMRYKQSRVWYCTRQWALQSE